MKRNLLHSSPFSVLLGKTYPSVTGCTCLWVVCQVNAFVPELPTDLVYSLETTDDKLFKV